MELDFKTVLARLDALQNQVEDLKNQLGRTARMESGSGGGGGWTAVDASTGTKGIGAVSVAPASPTLPIFVGDNDPRNTNSRPPNGAAGGVLNGTYPNPGLAQDRVNLIAGTSLPGTSQAGSQRLTGVVAADLAFYLGLVPIMDSGSTFPTSGLVDGQRYRNMTYRSWFTYNLSQLKWRQESPGVFDGAFPTVSSGDNTVAPNIEVKRKDLDNTIYFWNGTYWLSPINNMVPGWIPAMPSNSIAVSTQVIANITRPHPTADIWIESCTMRLNNVGAPDASNYWTLELSSQADSTAITSLGTVDHKVAGIATKSVAIIGAVRVRSLTLSNQFFVGLTRVGSPGNVNVVPPVIQYRLVG